MNSGEQNHGTVGREQQESSSGRSDVGQVVGFLIVLVVAAIGIVVAFTHVMLPHWMAALTPWKNGQSLPAVVQHLIWFHHIVLTHWKAAILALAFAIAISSAFRHGCTGRTDT